MKSDDEDGSVTVVAGSNHVKRAEPVAPRCIHPSGLTEADQELLLDLAELSIRASLAGTPYLGPDIARLPERLHRCCCAFVTLHLGRDFFGCQGGLGGFDPIGDCVPRLAREAAFEMSPRGPIRRTDLNRMHIEVSIVDRRIAIPSSSRREVRRRLQRDTDGLSVITPTGGAVLLPAAWKFRPNPDDFIDLLMARAGLDPGVWPADLAAERLETTDFGRLLW